MAIQQVTTLALKNDAVTEPKIANGAITAIDLGNNSIVTNTLQDNSVTTSKLDSTGIAPTITGGTINNATIGATIPANVNAVNLTVTNSVTLSNALGVAYGGTGATGAANARSNLGVVIGTDVAPATSGTSILKGNGSGGFSNAVGGTDYQDVLVSNTNIKTINSTSLLGSGDVTVQPTLVSGTNIKTINSTSLLGSGDISITIPVAAKMATFTNYGGF